MAQHGRVKVAGGLAFVVGGSSGIGLALGRQLAEQGTSVALFARRLDVLESAVEQLRATAADGTRVERYQLDASNALEVDEVVARAMEELGVPDLLINSAGGAKPQRFEDVTEQDLLHTIKSNVLSTWYPCQSVVPRMKQRGSGTIVNVSSVAGIVGVFGFTDYSLAKFGIVGFSEALRSELEPHGIKVQVLCPPDTQTPGLERENETKPPETAAISAGAKLMSAEDVAVACIRNLRSRRFLVFPNKESRFIDFARRWIPGIVRWQTDVVVRRFS